MNNVTLIGRTTKDPEVRYSQGEAPTAIARFTLAVDRGKKKSNAEHTTDFINCKAFGKTAETIEKYVTKGMKIALNGSIQTGNYTNKDGQKVYYTEVVADRIEFCESKGTSSPAPAPASAADEGGFMNIPDDFDEELPFN